MGRSPDRVDRCADAKRRFGDFAKPEFRLANARHEVYKLPAWPGPHGDRVWVYVLPRADGRDLLILGHKANWLGGNEVPTRYDEVVELMLDTLIVKPAPASQPQRGLVDGGTPALLAVGICDPRRP